MHHPGTTSGIIAGLLLMLLTAVASAMDKADFVYVDKSAAKLYLSKDGRIIKEYKVAFGANPKGHKQREGDNRTPEGLYLLDFKKDNSEYHKAIHISYPNREDVFRAKRQGLNPGGDIMIHGQMKGYEQYAHIMQDFNWTNGCIALSNQDLEEVWAAIEVPVPIRIKP